MKRKTRESIRICIALLMCIVWSSTGFFISGNPIFERGLNPNRPSVFLIAWNLGGLMIILRLLGRFEIKNKEKIRKIKPRRIKKTNIQDELPFRKLTKNEKRMVERIRKWGTILLLVALLIVMIQTLLQMLECSKAMNYVGDPNVCKMCDILIGSGVIVEDFGSPMDSGGFG